MAQMRNEPEWKKCLFLLLFLFVIALGIFFSPFLAIFEETPDERKKREASEEKDLAEQRRRHWRSLTPEQQMAQHWEDIKRVKDLLVQVKNLYPVRGYIKTTEQETHEPSRILEQHT